MKVGQNWWGVLMIALPIIGIWILQGCKEAGNDWASTGQAILAIVFVMSLGWIIHQVTRK